MLPTNLAQLRSQSSGNAPEGPPSQANPGSAQARPEKLLTPQQLQAQLTDVPAKMAEKIAAAKRKVEETVGGVSRGEIADFLKAKAEE